MKITSELILKPVTIDYNFKNKSLYANGYISPKVSPSGIRLKGFVFIMGKTVIHLVEEKLNDVVEIKNPPANLVKDLKKRTELVRKLESREENKLLRRLENERAKSAMERKRPSYQQPGLGI